MTISDTNEVRKPANTKERVAAAICKAAAHVMQSECPTCADGLCTMWPQFITEAEAAMNEIRRSRR